MTRAMLLSNIVEMAEKALSGPVHGADVADVPAVRRPAARTRRRTRARTARLYPSTVGGYFYLLVLVATGVGIGITWTGDWRDGVKWIGGALILAAVIRLVLPARSAGMLAVRNRAVDAVMLSAVGATLIILSESIPNQPL